MAMRTIGKGITSAKMLSAVLNLPPPLHHKNWSAHIKRWGEIAGKVLTKSFETARMKAKRLATKLAGITFSTEEELKDTPVDVPTSLDGSWKSRSMSKHGFVAAIAVDTAQVMDSEYLCSTCPACIKWENTPRTSMEYLSWYSKHGETCPINHEGSPQAMESEGVSILYSRSADIAIRYNPFVGDGDSKAFRRITSEKPYGEAFEHDKEECIGHIQKRMGTRLRREVERSRGNEIQ